MICPARLSLTLGPAAVQCQCLTVPALGVQVCRRGYRDSGWVRIMMSVTVSGPRAPGPDQA